MSIPPGTPVTASVAEDAPGDVLQTGPASQQPRHPSAPLLPLLKHLHCSPDH